MDIKDIFSIIAVIASLASFVPFPPFPNRFYASIVSITFMLLANVDTLQSLQKIDVNDEQSLNKS